MKRNLCWIDPNDPLPDTSLALTVEDGANGLLAAGADLSPQRLIQAYSKGIFPWFSRGEPVLWWAPSPRMVLMVDEFKVAKSFRKDIERAWQCDQTEITCDLDFLGTMQSCARPREANGGTWISEPMIGAYQGLHELGLAHSLQVMRDGQCIGGLYCVSLGRMVFGESMFSLAPGASKLALAALVGWLRRQGGTVIDCQQRTDHLASLGGREIERPVFESHLEELSCVDSLPWALDPPSKHDLRAFIRSQ